VATDTLVSDIYHMIDTKEIPEGVDVEEAIETFGENCKQMMRNNITESKFDSRKLRMSNSKTDNCGILITVIKVRNLCLTLESSSSTDT
jgi:hypothetical protein